MKKAVLLVAALILAAPAAAEVFDPGHAFFSARGAYGFLSPGEQGLMNSYSSNATISVSDYELGAQCGMEYSRTAYGLGFTYESHGLSYYWNNAAYFNGATSGSYAVYAVPLFMEAHLKLRYMKPGIQFGPQALLYRGYPGDPWGVGFQITPTVKFPLNRHLEFVLDGRYSQPLYLTLPHADMTGFGRWTLGLGFTLRT